MKLTLVLTVFLVLVSTMMTSAKPQGSPFVCVCTDDYTPVCGQDGRTHGNYCYMKCEGVKLAHNGECVEDKNKLML